MTERIIPKISIITVVMDDLAGFKVTAASIFAQENRALEWVIVDGSKSDEILQYLSNNQFNSISISYLKEAPNGIYAAMNTGWRNSLGLFCWYLNAGDYFSSVRSTEIAMNYLDVETDAVAFPVLHVNFDGFIYAITVPEILDISPLEYHAIINHQGALIKREVINVLGGFDETLRYASDGKLLDSVAKNFKIKLCPEAIVAFVHGGASSSNHKKVWDEIKTYRTPTISISQIYLRTLKTQIRTYFFGRKGDSIIGAVVKVLLRRRFEKIKRNSGKIIFYLDLINSLK